MFDDVGGQPLPCSPPDSIAQNTNLLDAYSKLSDLDEQLRQQTAHSEEPLIHIRILGYFMIYSPTAQGREFVASTVLECDDDEAIIKQGEVFLKYIIRAFRKYKGGTPDSSFSTVDALESTKDAIKALLKEGSRSHKQAKKLALYRENHQCPVTKSYDRCTKKLEGFRHLPRNNTSWINTECCHIIPVCLKSGIGDDDDDKGEKGELESDRTSSFWTILAGFGYDNIFEELNGDGIHRIQNVLSLQHDIHDLFDTLDLWFEATDTKDLYKLRSTQALPSSSNGFADFRNDDPNSLPPPSSDYLAIHAAVCIVAQMSGAAAFVEEFYENWGDTHVLAADGTSARLLQFVLEPLSMASPLSVH